MLSRLILLSALVLAAVSAQATTTLQFSVAPTGATNFANSSGVATNGMAWGVIIDTTSGTFATGSYDAFNTAVAGFLTVGGVATDDYYVPSGLVTQALGAPFFTGSESGNGGITSINTVPDVGTVTNLTAGDKFGIVWFQSSTANAGDSYGFQTFADFTMPGAGAVQSYASDFQSASPDPIKSASFTIPTTVPEPGMASLSLLGFAGLFFRRRR
jgi:hypothetical protein